MTTPRFCVIATVVRRATARAVCRAFITAMRVYGIPDEVLSDNGKQFTGRFGKPRPAEVLFERICRRNGIRQLLTKPYSPTTTGKVAGTRPCKWSFLTTRGRSRPSRKHRPQSMDGGGIQPAPPAPVPGHDLSSRCVSGASGGR
jgi:Integrase core domain